jgi:pilus assembly protein Flp/PilA
MARIRKPTRLLARYLRDDRGSAAVEYGLIAALIGGVVIAAVTAMGTSLNSQLTTIATHLNPAA